MKTIGILLLAHIACAEPSIVTTPPKEVAPLPMTTFRFDQDKPGTLPQGLQFLPVGKAPGMHWEILRDFQAVSKPHVLVQNGQAEPGQNGAMALIDKASKKDGEISVRFKIAGGERDQGAGFIWRYQDPQTYYAVLANAHEDHCAVYRVKKGLFKLLDAKAAIVSPYTWHELRLVFVDNHYTVLLDNEVVLGGKDKGILAAGQLGLWTIGDSVIRFDDLSVSK